MEELDQLAGLAAAADADSAPPAGAPAPENEPAQNVPGPDEQALDMINGFAGLLAGYAPDTTAIWTEQARQASAAAIAPLMVKYNFSLMAIPPELTAAIVVGPLLYRSASIVGDKIKADRATKRVPPVGAPSTAGPVDASGQPAAPAPAIDQAPAVAVHPQMALYK